jgi:hypothetical protein
MSVKPRVLGKIMVVEKVRVYEAFRVYCEVQAVSVPPFELMDGRAVYSVYFAGAS